MCMRLLQIFFNVAVAFECVCVPPRGSEKVYNRALTLAMELFTSSDPCCSLRSQHNGADATRDSQDRFFENRKLVKKITFSLQNCFFFPASLEKNILPSLLASRVVHVNFIHSTTARILSGQSGYDFQLLSLWEKCHFFSAFQLFYNFIEFYKFPQLCTFSMDSGQPSVFCEFVPDPRFYRIL